MCEFNCIYLDKYWKYVICLHSIIIDVINYLLGIIVLLVLSLHRLFFFFSISGHLVPFYILIFLYCLMCFPMEVLLCVYIIMSPYFLFICVLVSLFFHCFADFNPCIDITSIISSSFRQDFHLKSLLWIVDYVIISFFFF